MKQVDVAAFLDYWDECGHGWEALAPEIAEATGWRVWNPGLYGAPWHRERVRCYPPQTGGLLVCGLNPGPYGMGTTGVPFTDLMRIEQQLPRLHQRLIEAGLWTGARGLVPDDLRPFLNRTWEQSALRVYELLALLYDGNAEYGLTRLATANPCTLLFMQPGVPSSPNRTPADLSTAIRRQHPDWPRERERDLIERIAALRLASARKAVALLRPSGILLFGADVAAILQAPLQADAQQEGYRVVPVRHPARSPAAWASEVVAALRARGLA